MIERSNDPKGCDLCKKITGVSCMRPYTLQTPAKARIAINEKGYQFLIESKPIFTCKLRVKILTSLANQIAALLAANSAEEQSQNPS